jgi:hypothetical protein
MNNRNGLIVVIVLLLVIIAGLLALIFIPGKTLAPSQQPSDSTDVSQPGSAAGSSASGNNSNGVDNGVGDGTTPTSNVAFIENLIEVKAPLRGASVKSPLTITGNARGGWYFEASAPVELQDSKGNVIAQGHIDAQGDWMTENYVPFKATLTFPKQPAGSSGTLVLKNDNPSGDPSRGYELDIPVKF